MRRDVHTSDTASRARAGERASDQSHSTGGLPPAAGRFARLRQTRRTGLLGVTEIVALTAAAALLALAAAAYFLLLIPERSNLTRLENERGQLQNQIRSAGETREEKRGVVETVDRIRQSLTHFETDALVPRDGSERALIEDLNAKIKRSGLSRAQFSFIYQDDSQAGASQGAQQRAAANLSGSARRRQTVFPATDISLTIEGSYANLRRFIRDVESSPRFVVVNGVQLEGINETGADPSRAALVSLRLDMSAYFRRSVASSIPDGGGATAARQGSSQ